MVSSSMSQKLSSDSVRSEIVLGFILFCLWFYFNQNLNTQDMQQKLNCEIFQYTERGGFDGKILRRPMKNNTCLFFTGQIRVY